MPLQDRTDPCYRWMVHHDTKYREANAILVNSFNSVEIGLARILSQPDTMGSWPAVYLISVLIHTEDNNKGTPPLCMEWLDRQPPRSAIFV